MQKDQILQSDVLDIIFDGKNKAYGAYDLRKNYQNRLTASLLLTFLLIAIFILVSAWTQNKNSRSIKTDMDINESVVIAIPKDKPVYIPPIPPVKVAPPVTVAAIKFSTPRVSPDDDVLIYPPEVKELEEANIALESMNGRKFDGMIAPPDNVNGSQILFKQVQKEENDKEIFFKVEIEAQFPGGSQKWAQYIQRAISSQIEEFNETDFGTCIVKFIVDKNGNVSEVQATNMIGSKLAEIAVNTIRKGPKWIPAEQNGKKVNAYRMQPVTIIEGDK